MINITFKGGPFLFTGESLEHSGAITTAERFTRGEVSFAHYWPRGEHGVVKRYCEIIGDRRDIEVVGPAEMPHMDGGDYILALDNMLGGDPGWYEKPR